MNEWKLKEKAAQLSDWFFHLFFPFYEYKNWWEKNTRSQVVTRLTRSHFPLKLKTSLNLLNNSKVAKTSYKGNVNATQVVSNCRKLMFLDVLSLFESMPFKCDTGLTAMHRGKYFLKERVNFLSTPNIDAILGLQLCL